MTEPRSPDGGTATGSSARATHWEHVDEILELAMAAPPERRDAFLRAACRGNPALREEVESLLAHVLDGEGLLANLSAVLSGRRGDGAPAAANDELVGQTIGRYAVEERIGGGMAAVYRAQDALGERPVVLKLTAPGLGGDELDEARLRIEREAFTDQRVAHPSICRVLDSGRTHEGRGFLVLEFCEGRTLRDRLAEAPLGVEGAVSVTRQLASALAAAHEVGLIHRDVKPSNVMLAESGAAKLLDFGVAKDQDEQLTRTGQVLGTLEYMSPEQVSAQPIEPATDVWSLGLVLYESATGRHPFRKASRRETIRAISTASEPASYPVAGASVLEGLVRAMLAPEARNRPTAVEVEAGLAVLHEGYRDGR